MLPEVYPPVIDLLISLLTALRRIYKPVIDNVTHKMIESNLDFYLEEITESSRNKNRIKELKSIKIIKFLMLGRIQLNDFFNTESTKSRSSNYTYVAKVSNVLAALK